MSEIIDISKEKSEDKRDIEMEEKEKMLNAENKQEKLEDSEDVKVKGESKEGMEVKPKKIPIGGIQMPGFFTRSKSKERCKEDEQEVDGSDLIETKTTDDPPPSRIKLPNPFRKSKTDDDPDKSQEPKEKRKLLDTIRLPLVSVFPKKKKEEQKLETQAGLASMETLDDKSTDDKGEEMKTVSLEEGKDPKKDNKDIEGQEITEEMSWRERVKAYRVAISAFLVFLLLIVIIVLVAVPGKEELREAPVKDGRFVEAVTSCGKVEGQLEDSAIAFRGIPYARPPLGPLRFKYAQPLNDLSYCWNGTFLAHNATPTCLQIHGNGTVTGSEDCLTLDVITPYVRYTDPLPVVVMVGAGTLMGDAPGKLRPSARYARSKDVVFVRPNFRLGALGFLALEVLSRDDYPHTSGNYALSDIIEALKWVQLNIEHFGGDKKAVTLVGHRAGATLVTALASMPYAPKYFARAWATSGSTVFPKRTRQEAELENRSFLQFIDCQNVTCLRSIDARKIVQSVQDTWRKPPPDLPTKDELNANKHEWLVIDEQFLLETPANFWIDKKPDLIIGSTAQVDSSEKLLLKHKEWNEFLVKKHIEESVLDVTNLYPLTYKGLSTLISDIRTVCPLIAMAAQMKEVPVYVVTQTRGDDLADGDSDIDAILGRYEPKTPEQKRFFSAMQGLFYHYVYFGKVEHNFNKNVLIVGQDVLPNNTYSHCKYWIEDGLKFASLD